MSLTRTFMLLAMVALPTASLYPFGSVPGDKDKDKSEATAPVGTRITEFTLTDATTGKPWALALETADQRAAEMLHQRHAAAQAADLRLRRISESNEFKPISQTLHRYFAF